MITEKTLQALQKVLEPGEQALVTFKTAWKPRFGTPTLWLSATDDRILLFSTLRGGCIFAEAKFSQINSLVAEQGGRVLKVLFWDGKIEDLHFPVDDSVSPELVNKLLEEVNNRLANVRETPKDQ